MSKKTVLVAGGAGFIGSHLCKTLVDRGNFVIALDNLSSGSKKNLAGLQGNKKFKFIKGDVRRPPSVKAGEIYHLASLASPPSFQKFPLEIFEANVLGCLNLLRLAKKSGARFLFASTSEVYGNPLVHPQAENYWGNVNPVGLRSCYDESKRAGEALCMDFRRQFGVDAKIVRIFNTYGPHMDSQDGRVVSILLSKLCAASR